MSYMGGGNFVDGFRRLFKRRSSTLTTSNSVIDHNDKDRLTSLHEKEEGLVITEDFDFSGLKPIKVPFPVTTSSASMDPHKKVFFFLGSFI